MLHIRKRILSNILSPSLPTIPKTCSLHRLLSAAANPFAAEEYLVASCGLSREQALEASKKISHLKSPSKPDAVLSFLSGLGLSRADVATVVANDPICLCADVERTLAPRVVELNGLGLSRAEIARLALVAQTHFRSSSLRRNLEFWLPVFGSLDKLLQVLNTNIGLFSMDLENVARPNLALFQRCGIIVSDFPSEFMSRMLTRSTKHLQIALARVEEFGIEQSLTVFPHALSTFASLSPEKSPRICNCWRGLDGQKMIYH